MKRGLILKTTLVFIGLIAISQQKFTQEDFSQCLLKCDKQFNYVCNQSDDCKASGEIVNKILTDDSPENESCKNFISAWQDMQEEDEFPSQNYLGCLEYASNIQELKDINNDIFLQIEQCNCQCAEQLKEGQQTSCHYYTPTPPPSSNTDL